MKLSILASILAACAASPDKIRGVNLGGWLVLEPWITPSIFENANSLAPDNSTTIVDQWTLCEVLGYDTAQSILTKHWESWVSEDDLATLASAGITHLRLPVGYWAVDIEGDEPWVDGSWPYVEKLLGWADKHGLKVLLDLHGAPGSQNGFDNSGRKGDIHWPTPNAAGEYTNITRTAGVIEEMVHRLVDGGYGAHDSSLWGVELVNEPFFVDQELVLEYYHSAYQFTHLPTGNGETKATIIHDDFLFNNWYGKMQPPEYQNVYLDTHIYEAFNTAAFNMTYDEIVDDSCAKQSTLSDMDGNLWTIVGEWSLASTDCTKYLNGYGVGARFDGSMDGYAGWGSCEGLSDVSSFSDEYKQWLRRFAESQMSAYEGSAGWFFWNFKTEQSPQWDYLMGLREGYIPSIAGERTHSC